MVVRTSARPSVQDFAGAAYAHLLLVENLLKLQFDLISIHTQTHVKNDLGIVILPYDCLLSFDDVKISVSIETYQK